MPEDVRQALDERGLSESYHERPFYQRNDYLAWIGRAKRPETRSKRIEQMLGELEPGGYLHGDGSPSQHEIVGTQGRHEPSAGVGFGPAQGRTNRRLLPS